MEELEINPETASAPEENAASQQHPAHEESAAAPEENSTAEAQSPEEHAAEDSAPVTPDAIAPEAIAPEADAPEATGSDPAAATGDAPTDDRPSDDRLPDGAPDDGSEPAASLEILLSPEEAEPVPVAISDEHLQAILECVVYVAEDPLTLAQIVSALSQPVDRVEGLLRKLIDEFEKPGHGIGIREVAGGYKMATKAEHHEAVRSFVKSLKPPLKLSLPALETLAVIAYKQPVTSPEIMEIRGVQGAGVLKTLLDRKLIAGAGRKNVIGKPILYKTTKEFLIQFGLKDIAELPSIKEFEEIRRMAFADSEPAPAEVPAAPAAALEAMASEAALQPESQPESAPEAATEAAPEAASELAAGPIPAQPQTDNEPEPPAHPAPAPEPEA
jgi:segregation and condensation protein B